MTGSGTLADPYIIQNVNDLQNMNLDLTAYYELGCDIDALKPEWSWPSQIRRPSGDLASAGTWTVFPAAPATKWDKVCEVVQDGDATYITGVSNGAWALFSFPNFGIPVAAQNIALEVCAFVRNDATGSSSVQARIRVNGVDYLGTTQTFTHNDYRQEVRYSFLTNPATLLPWTVDDINGVGANPLQGFGITVPDAAPDVLITQVYATVYCLGFDPIGTYNATHPEYAFSGYFDGKGHTISNLFINRPSEEYVGLFGYTSNCGNSHWIKNVGLEDVNITGQSEVGALVGFHENDAHTISNCHATGSIAGEDVLIGGLLGYNGSPVSDCYSECNIIITSLGAYHIIEIGGFIGEESSNGVTRCYSTGSITINGATGCDVRMVGGFAGDILFGLTSQCHATGDIIINNAVGRHTYCIGGFVGYNAGIDGILNCYGRGDVTVTKGLGTNQEDVGGFVGYNDAPLQNAYSTGALTATGMTYIGGFCGENSDVITSCYWDTQTSGLVTSDGGTGKTTEEMNHLPIFTAAGWDFTSIWNISRVSTVKAGNITAGSAVLDGLLALTIINDAYPFLRWQTVVELPCDCGFEWGETEAFGHVTAVDSKNTGESFAKAIAGLEYNTTYYYRALASASPGPIHGDPKSFTTLVGIEVETLPATNITENSARIWGRVRKVPVTAMARFDWGGNIEYGAQTPWVPGLVSDDMFYFDLTNLAEGRAYHFRAMAMGSSLVYGNDMVFTTRSPVGPVVLIQEELAHLMEVS